MKLNYKRTIFVGFAFFLICTFWQAYDTIIPKILTDQYGMSQAASGVVMAMDNVLALFMLPLFGAISDRCMSKRGRRTPFIIVGTIVAAAGLICLSFVDNRQLANISDVSAIDDPASLSTLYQAEKDATLKAPDGTQYVLSDLYTEQAFTAIPAQITENGKTVTNPAYVNHVVPARHAYAWAKTQENPSTLILFLGVLLIILVAMAIFRSPAVALMPDVTIKPLRSKGNAVINLMGTAGGILVLGLGMVFATGSIRNSLMNYTTFFAIVAGIMLVALAVFLWQVNEPKFVEEMQKESEKYHLDEAQGGSEGAESKKLSSGELKSLLLILASVVFWFMGYNAVTSKYSVYAGKVLALDYNSTLLIANIAAIVSYLPVGFVASKIGRKKTILGGIVMLAASFLVASFLREGSSPLVMNCMFALAGIGWATINVNSFPMVVELSRGGDVGRYTGFYYTASMAAQTVTPWISGLFMDHVGLTTLFPYAAIFVALSFVTMCFVRHGDSKPIPAKSRLEAFDTED
jgi:maltose/moltooligosaccharide transporter